MAWLNDLINGLDLKDELVPRHYTIIGESEKPELEKYEIQEKEKKEAGVRAIRGNFEAELA